MLRRLLLVMSVAALMAAMMAATAVPAFATVHPFSKSERSNAPGGTAAATQDPPGLTPDEFGGTGQSQGSPPDNPTNSTLAQPVFAVIAHQPQSENVDPFDPTTFPENGPFKPEG